MPPVNEMLREIWYHLYDLKIVKNTHGRVLLLVTLQAKASNTPPWVFFMFFNCSNGTKLYKASQIILELNDSLAQHFI